MQHCVHCERSRDASSRNGLAWKKGKARDLGHGIWAFKEKMAQLLNFLSVPIFVGFRSPSPARRRVMRDAGSDCGCQEKKQANACNALLHQLAFSLHQSGQQCLFITWVVHGGEQSGVERCTEKYHHRKENIGVKLIAGTTALLRCLVCLQESLMIVEFFIATINSCCSLFIVHRQSQVITAAAYGD